MQAQCTLSVPPITGRIALGHIQHAPFVESCLKRVRLFVLTPLEDEQARRLVKVDSYLEDFSPRLPM
jgi:hypothetical protein